MNNITKWLYSVVLGSIATFFGQYGLFIVLVALAVVFDIITGLVKVKATDAKTQIGAFTVLDNAKKTADKNSGYKVFDVSGNVVYTPKTGTKKTVAEIAKEVIQGKWGNGVERVQKLTAAGYDYNEVQREVNRLMSV